MPVLFMSMRQFSKRRGSLDIVLDVISVPVECAVTALANLEPLIRLRHLPEGPYCCWCSLRRNILPLQALFSM